jgi:hypothetical protein
MLDLIFMMLGSFLRSFRTHAAIQAELIALRHQLVVLQRTQKKNRLILHRGDRCLWVWLSQLWSGWRSALIIVKPGNRNRLAPSRIPAVLDLEDSSRTEWATACIEGNSRSDPIHEPDERALGSTSNP